MELRSEPKVVACSPSRKFSTVGFQTDLGNLPLLHWEKVPLFFFFACVAVCGWQDRSWDFSPCTTRRPAPRLPNAVSSWHWRQKVMLSGFLLFPPLVFSKDWDRWNTTPSAPCPCHNAVHLSKLQTSAIICAFCQTEGKLSLLGGKVASYVKGGILRHSLLQGGGETVQVHTICCPLGARHPLASSRHPNELGIVVGAISFILKLFLKNFALNEELHRKYMKIPYTPHPASFLWWWHLTKLRSTVF